MTPTEQQIALCVWMRWKQKAIALPDGSCPMYEIPPNTDSLDGLHDMLVKARAEIDRFDVLFENQLDRFGVPYWLITVEQGCEALLRTLNLWVE